MRLILTCSVWSEMKSYKNKYCKTYRSWLIAPVCKLLRLVAACARKRLCHSQFFSFLLNYFSDQQRLQGWFHPLSTSWQSCNSSISWKHKKGVTDSRVWPLAAMYHLNGMCSCLPIIWKFLDSKHSSRLGLLASASALQIIRTSFKRSFEAKICISLREVQVKFITPAMAENRSAGPEAMAPQRCHGAGREPVPDAALPGRIQVERWKLWKAKREKEVVHRAQCCWRAVGLQALQVCFWFRVAPVAVEPHYVPCVACLFTNLQELCFSEQGRWLRHCRSNLS